MDKINLEQIIRDQLTKDNWYMVNTIISSIVKAMKTACDNTVDLCSENALTKMEGERLVYGPSPTWWAVIDKESILKTKEQIK
jgi:hypothetical protein